MVYYIYNQKEEVLNKMLKILQPKHLLGIQLKIHLYKSPWKRSD